jgi:hypothetical protein
MKDQKYEFTPLPEPKPGLGFGKHFAIEFRQHGRSVFLDAVQEFPEDLPLDPWGDGNSEPPEFWIP